MEAVALYKAAIKFASCKYLLFLFFRVMAVARKYAKGPRRITFAISDASEFRQELLDFDLDPSAEKPLVAARDDSQRRFAMRADFR